MNKLVKIALDFEPPPPKQNSARKRAGFFKFHCKPNTNSMGVPSARPRINPRQTYLFCLGVVIWFRSNLFWKELKLILRSAFVFSLIFLLRSTNVSILNSDSFCETISLGKDSQNFGFLFFEIRRGFWFGFGAQKFKFKKIDSLGLCDIYTSVIILCYRWHPSAYPPRALPLWLLAPTCLGIVTAQIQGKWAVTILLGERKFPLPGSGLLLITGV